MNDLTFTGNLESWRNLRFPNATKAPSSTPYQAEGNTADSYVEVSNASCSVYNPGVDSGNSFWRLFFSLFSSD
jgi:hypothetical protein